MSVLRTPDDRFTNLSDYHFKPNYIEINPNLQHIDQPLRMHYVDVSNASHPTETILLLHGEPSWSYLYRHMIRQLAQHGYRVVAPDLIGFGKSDKLAHKSDYTYARHSNWITQFIEHLDLNNITLFCQDWGSLIGLQIVGTPAVQHRFARVVVSNGGLPTGKDQPTDAFIRWQKYAAKQTEMNCGELVQGATVSKLSEAEIAAYNAPYPDKSYQAGPLVFPSLVPTPWNKSEDNVRAWQSLRQFKKPFLTCFGDSDPVTRNGQSALQKAIPGCKHAGVDHTVVQGGGHFIQEDCSPQLVQIIVKLIESTPLQQIAKL